MGNVSNQISVRVVPLSVPTWYSQLNHKQWTAPVSNWIGANGVRDPIADLILGNGHTSNSGVINAYNGMGADSSRGQIFLPGNGGHNDYYGNEVYVCDLWQEAPAWARRWTATYPIPANNTGSWTKWPDGRPSSNHTLALPLAAEGRWFVPGCGSRNFSPGSADHTQWWEIDVNGTGASISGLQWDWIDGGAGHTAGPGNVFLGAAAFDAQDRMIIKLAALSAATPSVTFTPITNYAGPHTVQNNTPINDSNYMQMEVDTTNRMLVILSNSDGRCYVLSLANKTATMNSFIPSGTPPSDNRGHLNWHPPSQAFVTIHGAGTDSPNMYKLKPTVVGGQYTGLTWSHVTGFTGVTPLATNMSSGGGVSKKFQLLSMQDGSYAAVWWSRWANPDVYVCKLNQELT